MTLDEQVDRLVEHGSIVQEDEDRTTFENRQL